MMKNLMINKNGKLEVKNSTFLYWDKILELIFGNKSFFCFEHFLKKTL